MGFKELSTIAALLAAFIGRLAVMPLHAQSATKLALTADGPCRIFNLQDRHASAGESAELLAAYNGQVNSIRRLHAVTFLRGTIGKQYRAGSGFREIPAIIDMARPDSIRIEGVLSFMGSRGFEMASDGREFSLLIPEDGKKRFVIGPVGAPAVSSNPKENLRPEPLLDALRWQEAHIDTSAAETAGGGPGLRSLAVRLTESRGGVNSAKVEFDTEAGVVTSLLTFDVFGHMLTTITYKDWKPMSIYPEGPATGCFPRLVHVVRPDAGYEFDIRIVEIFLNPDISKSIFRPSSPRGIPIVHLDLSGNMSDH